jgi:hypothetical protein
VTHWFYYLTRRYYASLSFVNDIFTDCGSNVNLTGVNGNVIMSGCGDDNPDDTRREANSTWKHGRLDPVYRKPFDFLVENY